jgi:hypothetical protein
MRLFDKDKLDNIARSYRLLVLPIIFQLNVVAFVGGEHAIAPR